MTGYGEDRVARSVELRVRGLESFRSISDPIKRTLMQAIW